MKHIYRVALHRLACVAVAVFALGCSTPQQSEPPSPSPTAAAIDVGEVELSNAFWEQNSNFAPTAYRYDSLADITTDAHVIIRGRIVGTQDGELQPFGAAGLRQATFGIVAVDEVLKGTPEMQVPGTVLIARLGVSNQPPQEIPAGEVILFLMHYPKMRTEAGVGQSVDPNDRFFYARPNGYQCVLRNLGGVVRIVDGPEGWEDALGPFPAPLDGEPFSDVLAEIRQTVARSSSRASGLRIAL